MRRWRSSSVEETRQLGETLAAELTPDRALLLSGDLGAGKTVLTQGVGRGLGIDPRQIQSPTFTLIRQHEGDAGSLVHVDLYRLGPEEVETIGLEEILFGPRVKVVEWADRLPFAVPDAVWLELRVVSAEKRRIVERPVKALPVVLQMK